MAGGGWEEGEGKALCLLRPCPSEDPLLPGPLPASLRPSRGELVGGEEQGACATPGPAHPQALTVLSGTFRLGRVGLNRKVYLTRSELGCTHPDPPRLHPVLSELPATARVCFWQVSPFSFLSRRDACTHLLLDQCQIEGRRVWADWSSAAGVPGSLGSALRPRFECTGTSGVRCGKVGWSWPCTPKSKPP